MSDVNVVLIPGDGIGPEVSAAVQHVFSAADIPINWIETRAGLCVTDDCPSGLPGETVALVREHGLALKGPTTTPSGQGHSSVNVQLRKQLGLFANVRPVKSLPAVKTRYSDIDLVVVRENLEDTYSGIEYMQSPHVAQGLKVITRQGSERICRFAFEYAVQHARKRVCCVHKANIHKMTDGLFLEAFQKIREQYTSIEAYDMLVDNACMQHVSDPNQFDVIVTPNLFGDIISDLSAGLVGGLGVAPSANIGVHAAIFEAVHGSAPDIAGKGLANPTALLLSALFMLRHIGLDAAADRIFTALCAALDAGRATRDLGGILSTEEFAIAIVECLDDSQCVGTSIHSPGSSKQYKITLPEEVEQGSVWGIDIFVRTLKFPEPPTEAACFALEGIANRGVRMHPGDRRLLTDVFQLRYRCEGAFSTQRLSELVEQLEAQGLNWVHIEKLQAFEAQLGFSEL